jgi:hypothetical protein
MYMAVPDTKTLLALFLALKDLDTISEDERASLRDTAYKLYLEPDNWKEQESDLLKTIQGNSQFNLLYQTYKSQLDAVKGEIPSHLLPTQAEVEAVIATNQSPVTRGKLPVNDDYKSNEIHNVAINVLSTANPVETAKKLSRIEQLQQFLQQSISGK